MSGFLARLASLATSTGTALVPRLPSRFEPAPGTSPMPVLSEGLEESGARGLAVPPRTVERFAPIMPLAATPRTLATTDSEAQSQRGTPAAQSPSVAAHARVRSESASSTVMPNSPPSRADGATPVMAPSALASKPRFQPAPVKPSHVRVAPVPAATRTLPVMPLPAGASPSVPRLRETPAMTPVAAIAASERPRRGVADTVHPTASETVVQVSIGRIEVRAAPATPAPAQRSEGPRPGRIEEYLRQRSGKASP